MIDGARSRRGRQQVVGAPGPQLVRGDELLVRIAEAPPARQRGHLVHDHLRPGEVCEDAISAIRQIWTIKINLVETEHRAQVAASAGRPQ